MQKRFFRFWKGLVAFLGVLAVAGFPAARGQETPPPSPYASIASKEVSYAGPGRDARYDLPGTTIRIGLVAPLHGREKSAGDAIVAAARIALEDAQWNPLPGGRQMTLTLADESVPAWGQFGNELIHLVLDEQAVAVVTSSSGVSAHLSEQIGNRIGVPILTLSSDSTTTQIDLPWIFRLAPSDTLQARLFAQDIYRDRGFENILLVTERNHDGRVGGEEFQKAARSLGAPPPDSVAVDPLQPDVGAFVKHAKAHPPQAIVFWTSSETAKRLVEQIRQARNHAPVYLSQQAAQHGWAQGVSRAGTAIEHDSDGAGIWTVESSAAQAPGTGSFARRYERATGKPPSCAAAEAYDAVRLVAEALRAAGANRARVRDQLATIKDFPGASGIISFDNQGNNRTTLRLVHVQ